jgi:hypothetical protein
MLLEKEMTLPQQLLLQMQKINIVYKNMVRKCIVLEARLSKTAE